MPVDLESRLHTYRTTLDDAIDSDRRRERSDAPHRSPRTVILAAAAAVLVGIAGVAAVTAIDRPQQDVQVAAPGEGSPTEGLLPRFLLDPADGWELWAVEDYPLLDTAGAFTALSYGRPADGLQQISIALRRTRERIIVGATDGGEEPCDGREVSVGDRTGYLVGNVSGDGSILFWTPDDHVLAIVSGSLPEAELVDIARRLVPRGEAEWMAATADVSSNIRITNAADSGVSWQDSWDARYVVDEFRTVPEPQLEFLDVPDNPEVSEPVWAFRFCVEPPAG